MALTSALYTGLSGLDVNQTAMQVIGNNIANVNTTAFKSSRALFTPQFYVTDAGGAAPTPVFGGTNPSQEGLGASVASIEKNFTAGSITATGVDTDMAIEGSGFFVVQGASQMYTRDGAFTLNSANQLVTADGNFVQGYGVDGSFNVVPGKLQNVTIPLGAASTAAATQNVIFNGNLNAGGSVGSGASVLNSQDLTSADGSGAPTGATLLTNIADATSPTTPLFNVGDVYTFQGVKGTRQLTPQTFTVSATSTLSDLTSFYQNTLGIDTNMTTPTGAPTPGVTVAADSANPGDAKIIVSGNIGNDNAITLGASAFSSSSGVSPFQFQKGTDAAGIANNPNGESIHTTATAYDSLGTPITVDVTATLQSTSSTGTVWQFEAESSGNKSTNLSPIVGQGTQTFDNNGKLLGSTGTTISIDRTGSGAKSPFSMQLDFSSVTSLASSISDLVMNKQDGSPLGSLQSFAIGSDGVITGTFSNGLTRSLGQVALANFNNPQGLNDNGANNYTASANSGAPIISAPMQLGAGQIRASSLEQSNVDLSREFTNLIIASTGFSAASHVINTSDQLIQQLLQQGR